ncbi:MAG: glutamine-hydrolyzing GMP synthase [candidate division Zixibacteria bacterium RBG_16_40_9]|nr:MAG: glutamine-hydrolyzing GMP synthase [candidate division Zixibacteria bacterium RBG_16_40_9]
METILILDFGSQYTQLIARRVREQKVFCEIYPGNLLVKSFPKNLKGIILSGGPSSVFDPEAPLVSKEIFNLKLPVLGICYGLQLTAHLLGGKVVKSQTREYGKAILQIQQDSELFQDCPKTFQVWMSHGDSVISLPDGFKALAKTETLNFAAIENKEKKIYGVQFHPEVIHTENGKKILQNFLFEICKCKGDWTTESFISSSVSRIKEEVDNQKIICAVSGGVDSTVCAALVNQAVGKNLLGIFVDNGVLRKNEAQEVLEALKKFNLNLIFVDAKRKFLKQLQGVIDPEEKRKIIGKVFIEVFEEEAHKIGEVKFLAQGTLYPDLIESRSFKGPSATIKSHHNVGGLPEVMNLRLVEPLKELFKDEVRELGKKLGLLETLLQRHPFPGPGLAVRVIGEVTENRLNLLREADFIFMEELKSSNLYDQVWQAFCVLLPVQSVGVMGDERTYENVVALRAVTSLDGMTADWAKLPYDLLQKISNRIINEVKGINRVVYDVSSKPPATIEWE